jgi:hypothetical protein
LKYVWTARQIVAELANLKALEDEYGGWMLQKPNRDVLDRETRHVVTYAAHCNFYIDCKHLKIFIYFFINKTSWKGKLQHKTSNDITLHIRTFVCSLYSTVPNKIRGR